MALEFTDSIDGNRELIRELLSQLPPSMRAEAKRAAVLIGDAVAGVKKDHPRNPAVGLGLAFAIFTVAQQLVQAETEGPRSERLIQLLS